MRFPRFYIALPWPFLIIWFFIWVIFMVLWVIVAAVYWVVRAIIRMCQSDGKKKTPPSATGKVSGHSWE